MSCLWCYTFCALVLVPIQCINSKQNYTAFDAYYAYAPTGYYAHKRLNNDSKVTEEKIKNQTNYTQQIFQSYNNYQRSSQRRDKRELNKSNVNMKAVGLQGREFNSIDNRVGNEAENFKKNVRYYQQPENNNLANMTWIHNFNKSTRRMNNIYQRRRQQGMFLNTSSLVRKKPSSFTFDKNIRNTFNNRSLGVPKNRTTDSHLFGNMWRHNSTKHSRLNVSFPFNNRWYQKKRTLRHSEFKKHENNKFNMIERSLPVNVGVGSSEKRLSRDVNQGVVTDQFGEEKTVFKSTEEDVRDNIVGNNAQTFAFTENRFDSLEDNEMERKQEEDITSSFPNGFTQTSLFSQSMAISDLGDEGINTEGSMTDFQVNKNHNIDESQRQNDAEKRKQDGSEQDKESKQSTMLRKLTTPRHRIMIHRVIDRNDLDFVRPLIQFTTSSTLQEPHDDTVLIQVPPRRPNCQPPMRLARGHCRRVW